MYSKATFAPYQVMSLSASTNNSAAVTAASIPILQGPQNYEQWGLRVQIHALTGRLLGELDKSLPYSANPETAKDVLKGDIDYWRRQLDLQVSAALKADGFTKSLPEPEFDPELFAVEDSGRSNADIKALMAARKTVHAAKVASRKAKSDAYTAAYKAHEKELGDSYKEDARRKFWHLVVSSLGQPYVDAPSSVKFGDAAALLLHIHQVLRRDSASEVTEIRERLYNSKFEKEGRCNIATWRFYFEQASARLQALGTPITAAELNSLFTNKLPDFFLPFRQSYHKEMKTATFAEMATLLQSYASTHDGRSFLEQLEVATGHSGVRDPRIYNAHTKEPCKRFLKGTCPNGSGCPYAHDKPPAGRANPDKSLPTCTHCGKARHTKETCWALHPELKRSKQQHQPAAARPSRAREVAYFLGTLDLAERNRLVREALQDCDNNHHQPDTPVSEDDPLSINFSYMFTVTKGDALRDTNPDFDPPPPLAKRLRTGPGPSKLNPLACEYVERNDHFLGHGRPAVIHGHGSPDANKKFETAASDLPQLLQVELKATPHPDGESAGVDLSRSLRKSLPSQSYTPVATRGEFWCFHCDIRFMYREQLDDHLRGPRHLRMAIHLGDPARANKTDWADQPLPKEWATLAKDCEDEAAAGAYYCQLCSYVSTVEKERHEAGQRHAKAERFMAATLNQRSPGESINMLLSMQGELARADAVPSEPPAPVLAVLDGGATVHATNDPTLCHDIRACDELISGVGGSVRCTSIGSLVLRTPVGRLVHFKDVRLSTTFPTTFISEVRVLVKGCKVRKQGDIATVLDAGGALLFTASLAGGLFKVDGEFLPVTRAANMSKSPPAAPRHVSPLENAKIAARSDIQRVASQDDGNYDREPIFRAADRSKIPPVAHRPIFHAANMSKSPPTAPRRVSPSENAKIAARSDILRVGSQESENCDREPIFRAVDVSKIPPAAHEPIFRATDMSKTPPAAPGHVLPSVDANITTRSDIHRVGSLENGNYDREPIFGSAAAPESEPPTAAQRASTKECFFDSPRDELALLARVYNSAKPSPDELLRFHRRMQHVSFARAAAAYGLKLPPSLELPLCDACVVSKSLNTPQHSPGMHLRASRRAEGLHTDFCGPFPEASLAGGRYLLVFVDDYTRAHWDFYPQSQSEFYDILSALLQRIDTELGVLNATSWIRSDNAKVYKADLRVQALCKARGIKQQFSSPHSPFQNGDAETHFHTVLPLIRANLHQSGLNHAYWEYCSRLVHTALMRMGVPHSVRGFRAGWSKLERWLNADVASQLGGIFPFGCLIYKHVAGELRKKLDDAARPSIYLGLSEDTRGVVALDMATGATSVTAVFVAHEGRFPLNDSTVATASRAFRQQHARAGVFEMPLSAYLPSGATAIPPGVQRDPRMNLPVDTSGTPDTPVTLASPALASPTRSLRGWTPQSGPAGGHRGRGGGYHSRSDAGR